MAELLRRTVRFYDDEKGRELVKILANTGQRANERLVQDIYIAEMLRKHYLMPLEEILIMLLSNQVNKPVDEILVQTDTVRVAKEKELNVDVSSTLSMLEKL